MKLKYIISSCILAISLNSCTNWLDVQPKTQISEKILFEDEQGFKDALIGVYVQMASSGLYGQNMTMSAMDVLAQQYDVASTLHRYYELGKYNYTNSGVEGMINQFWNGGYKAIANLNNLLTAIDAQKHLFTQNNYELVKGEALGLRAFLHFDLFRLYGPIPAQGMGENTIPYLKEFKMQFQPDLSGDEVLQACIDDLDAAINLLEVHQNVNYGLSDPFQSHTRNHFNYWAAHALKARIALYRGDKTLAYESAQKVIQNSNLFPFVQRDALVSGAPNRIFLSEVLFTIYTPQLKDINAANFKKGAGGNALTNTDMFITDLYEGSSTDYRRVFLWGTDGSTSELYPSKYREDDIQTSTLNTNRIPLIRLSEVYYIAAESSIDNKEKIELLNTVLNNRGLDRLGVDLTPSQIENEIFKEYRKEFYQEGQLFFYYKRKNVLRITGYGQDMSEREYVLPRPNDEIEFKNL